MKLLTSDEIFDTILKLVGQAKEEVKIASAWINGSLFKEIIDRIREKRLKLEVIIRVSEINDLNITNDDVFMVIRSVNGKVFISSRLHAKFLIVDKSKAVVGSANFTTAGLSGLERGNIEASSLYDEKDREEIERLYNYFEDIKSNYSLEVSDNIVGFALNPVKTDSFEFIMVSSNLEEQSYVQVEGNDSVILGKVRNIYSYDVSFFANPFSNSQSIIFAPFEDFKTIFSGNKHQDWKRVATFAYALQGSGEVRIATCDVIGQIDEVKLERVKKPFSVGTPVYLATSDRLRSLMRVNFNNIKMGSPVCIGKMEGTDIDVYIDLDEVISKHMFITGTTGSGKSHFTKSFLNKVLKDYKDVRIFVFDPHGEYYDSLKNSISGSQILHKEFEDTLIFANAEDFEELIKQIGFGNIVNRNSDIGKIFCRMLWKYIRPSLSSTGLKDNTISEIILEISKGISNSIKDKDISFVEDLKEYLKSLYGEVLDNQPAQLKGIEEQDDKRLYIYNLKKITDPGARVNLVGLILQYLFNRGKMDNKKRLIVLEEAHNFAPEKGYGDASAGRDNLSLVMARKIASEGRKFNLGLLVISQRPAQVNKYVLSQMNTQVMFRIINASDLEAIEKYVEYSSEDMLNLLPKFTTGTCIVSGVGVPMPMVVKGS